MEKIRESLRKYENVTFKYGLVSCSPVMKRVYGAIESLAGNSHDPVFIFGETGTGKELVAGAIHENSLREGKYICVNCAAIPDETAESELFGHVKGAFTGAVSDRAGKFREADTGTLFLDEIGEMDLPLQSKLLRAIEQRDNYYHEVTPVGSDRTEYVRVRVILATSKNLRQMMEQEKFEPNLFYRIHPPAIIIPPLRDRREDIPILANYFLEDISTAKGKKLELSPKALQYLCGHDWPGNVRELKKIVEQAAVLADGNVIGEDAFFVDDCDYSEQTLDNVGIAEKEGILHIKEDGKSLAEIVQTVERFFIDDAMKRCGSEVAAAKVLGISRDRLRYRRRRNFKVFSPLKGSEYPELPEQFTGKGESGEITKAHVSVCLDKRYSFEQIIRPFLGSVLKQAMERTDGDKRRAAKLLKMSPTEFSNFVDITKAVRGRSKKL